MGSQIIARGQITLTTQNDAYSLSQSVSEYVFSAENNGTIISEVTFKSSVKVIQDGVNITDFTIGSIPVPAGFSSIEIDNTQKIIEYSVAANTTTLADNGVIEIPVIIQGDTYYLSFVWSKAKKGAAGEDGYTIHLTQNNFVVSADKDGVIHTPVTVSTIVSAMKGTSTVLSVVGTLPTVDGCTLSKNRQTITIVFNTGSLLADNGTIKIPITVNGKAFTVTLSYAKVRNGADGVNTNMLDWVDEWNTNKTQIGSSSVITPKIYAGVKNSNGTLTGVALGRFALSTVNASGQIANETIDGIYGFKDGYRTFFVDNAGNAQLGRGNQFIKYNAATGKVEFGADVSLNWVNAANTALTSAKTYADTKKTEAIAAASMEAGNMIDAIQVGARNYIRNSTFDALSTSGILTIDKVVAKIDTENKFNGYNTIHVIQSIATSDEVRAYRVYFHGLKVCHPASFSMWIKASESTELRIRIGSSGAVDLPVNTSWQMIKVENKFPITSVVAFGVTTSGTEFDIACPMLVEGSKAADWSPAPEDVSQEISTAKNEAINDASEKINSIQIGGDNFIPNSDFRYYTSHQSIGWDEALNGTYRVTHWSTGYNKDVTNHTQGYHAHLNTDKFGYPVLEYINKNSLIGIPNRWQGLVCVLPSSQYIIPGETYTFSADVMVDTPGARIHGGLLSYKTGAVNYNFNSGSYNLTPTETNKWERLSYTFTADPDIDLTRLVRWYIYGHSGSEGISWVRNVALQLGTKGFWTRGNFDIEKDVNTAQKAGTDAQAVADALTQKAIDENWTTKLTYIDSAGIFTGTLSANTVNAIQINASQITAGKIDASRINVQSLKTVLITAGNIDALTLNVVRGKIGGWSIDSDSIYRGTKINYYWGYTPAPGSITIGSTGIRGNKWRLDASGAGAIAGGNIYWDEEGTVTFSTAVSLNWTSAINNVLSSATSYTDEKFLALNVGGKNYLRNSKLLQTSADQWGLSNATVSHENDYVHMQSTGINVSPYIYFWESGYHKMTEEFKVGETYTISFDARSNANKVRFGFRKDPSFAQTCYPLIDNKGVDSWHRYSHSFTINDEPWTNILWLLGVNGDADPSVYLQIKNFKLEKGNQATDWSPAPEDMDYLGTYINSKGIYTGTLTASQINVIGIDAGKITVGTLSADRIAANSIGTDKLKADEIKANIINTTYINGLSCTFTQGKIGGWLIGADNITAGAVGEVGQTPIQIRSTSSGSGYVYSGGIKPYGITLTWYRSSNAGSIIFGQILSAGNLIKTGYMGIQMMSYDSTEYFCLSANTTTTGSMEVYNRIASWAFDYDSLYRGAKNNNTGSFTSSSGSITIGSNGLRGYKWRLDSNGAGAIAGGNISWDASGNVSFSSSVSLNWTNVANDALNSAKAYADTVSSNIHVGGRNLLKNSGRWRNAGWNGGVSDNGGGYTINPSVVFNGMPTVLTYVGVGIYHHWLNLENGVEYTYSAMVLSNETVSGNDIIPMHYHAGYNQAAEGKLSVLKYDTSVVANVWKRIYIVFKLTGNANTFRPFIYRGNNSTTKFWVAYMKLEKGNKPTDWTPALEDTDYLGTYIDSNGIYTGSLNASQVNALTCSFDKGKIGGFTIDPGGLSIGNFGGGDTPFQIRGGSSGSGYYYVGAYKPFGATLTWHQNSNAGHIVFGQVAECGYGPKNGFIGIQMMSWDNEEYFCLSANYTRSGSKEVYNRIAGWAFDNTRIWKNSVILGSDGSIVNLSKWQLNNDGSGRVANGNIIWDAAGNVTFSNAVKLNWQNDATEKANEAKELAMAMAFGKMLYRDPTFKNGSNNINTYNNYGNGTVNLYRISDSTAPNDTKVVIQIVNTGSSTPSCGGFNFGTMTSYRKIFITRLIAKLPVGRSIEFHTNSMGTGGYQKWLTSNTGTGDWCEYVCKVVSGTSGFASTNYFALSGGVGSASAPVEWRLAYATVFDVTSTEHYTTTIDANGIYTGSIHAAQILVDSALVVGGSTYNGSISVRDASNVTKVTLDRTGITAVGGTIGGWVIASTQISKNGIVLGADGSITNGTKWKLNNDGSGQFANGNIYWTAAGSVSMTGTINATSGQIGGFEIGSGRIGSSASATGGGGELAIYNDFLRIGSSVSFAMLGDDCFPSTAGGAFKTTARLTNTRYDSYYTNIGLYLDVRNAKRNFGIHSNASIMGSAVISNKVKVVSFSTSGYTLDFSQHNVFYVYGVSKISVNMPTETSVADMFGLGSLPSDFGFVFHIIYHYNNANSLTFLNLRDNNGNLNNYEMGKGDSITVLCTKFPSFHYQVLTHYK